MRTFKKNYQVLGKPIQISTSHKQVIYECLQRHYTDLLVPCKLQFFAFVAGIFEPYLVIFQTD